MPAYANLAGVELGERHPVRVLGVINLSPESFYPGSVPGSEADLRDRARKMVDEGADFLDLGGMSTAPYKQTAIDEGEETRRVIAAVAAVCDAASVPISVDTSRAAVARAALDAGARIVNDIAGLRRDPAMADLAAARAEGVILMASPAGHEPPDPVGAVRGLLGESLRLAWKAGVREDRIVLDPGIGFFRSAGMAWHEWDREVLRRLGELAALGHPLAVGVSRKSFIGRILAKPDPADRLVGSLAATVVAVLNGAHLVRTHDVGPTREAIQVAEFLRQG